MNERIRELQNQADEYADEIFDRVKLFDRKGKMYGEIVMERFAELIVAECGVALSPMLRDMVSRGQAFDLIKDHFGVDE